jgi:hypothetical protein
MASLLDLWDLNNKNFPKFETLRLKDFMIGS